ncbi:MAG: LEA type 2 family protein [Smithella sp.]
MNSRKIRNYYKIFLTLVLLFFLTSCLSWIMEVPSFTIRGVTLRPVSFTGMSLLLDIDVRNPNFFDLKFKSFEYTVYLKNEPIGNGSLDNELLIPSSSTTRIKVPLSAQFKDLSGSLKAILTEKDLPYKISGKVTVKTLFGSRQFDFSNEGQINLKN